MAIIQVFTKIRKHNYLTHPSNTGFHYGFQSFLAVTRLTVDAISGQAIMYPSICIFHPGAAAINDLNSLTA